MLNFQKIEKLLLENKVPKTEFAAKIGVSEQWLHKVLHGEIKNPGVDKMELIADFFELPIDYFFDRFSSSLVEEEFVPYNKAKIQYLENIIEEKERTIRILSKKMR